MIKIRFPQIFSTQPNSAKNILIFFLFVSPLFFIADRVPPPDSVRELPLRHVEPLPDLAEPLRVGRPEHDHRLHTGGGAEGADVATDLRKGKTRWVQLFF